MTYASTYETSYSSPSRARFEAWLNDCVFTKEKTASGKGAAYRILSRELAQSLMADLASKRDYQRIKEIASQLENPIQVKPSDIVSKSYRMSFEPYVLLACKALSSKSNATRFLRDAFLEECGALLQKLDSRKDKKAILQAAIDCTRSLQSSDINAYARDSYSIPYYASDPKIAELLWEELIYQISPALSEEMLDKVDTLRETIAAEWTNIFSKDGNLGFVITAEDNQLKLKFGAYDLDFWIERNELEKIGLDPEEVDLFNAVLSKFILGDSNVYDEDCTISLTISDWSLQLIESHLTLDGKQFAKSEIESAKNQRLDRIQEEISYLESRLKVAIGNGMVNIISEVSDRLTQHKRRFELEKLASEFLTDLFDFKGAVVSFTASKLLFELATLSTHSFDELVLAEVRKPQR